MPPAQAKTNRAMLETTLGKIARILADRYDINVYFSGDDCFTQGRDIFLPALPDDCPADLREAVEGFLDHEAAHIIFSDFNAMSAIKDKYQQLWFNMLEDARVEERLKEIWRGCGLNLENADRWSNEQTLETWDQLHDFVKMAKAALLYAKRQTHILDTLPGAAELYAEIEPITPALKMAIEVPDTLHTIALSEWICKKLGHVPEEPAGLTEEEREELIEFSKELAGELTGSLPEGFEGEEGEGELPEEFQPSTGGSKSEEEELAEGEPKEPEEAEGKEEEGEEGTGEGTSSETSEEELAPELLEEQLKAMEEQAKELGSLISSQASRFRHYDTTKTEDVYLPYTTAHDEINIVEDGDKAKFSEILREVKRSSGVLLRKLKASLLSRYRAQMEYDKTWGKLNTKALPRLLVSGYPKVFKRKVTAETLNCRFSLLVDQSGSMRGNKNKEAIRAAILFGEFANQMGIPFEILGFTTTDFSVPDQQFNKATPAERKRFTRWGFLEINIYKQFHEDWRKVGHRLTNMKARCHNYDGEAVMFAAKRLLAAKGSNEERSLLFVFSDGQPEQAIYGFQPHHQRYLKKVTEQVQRNGIECFGIGIMTDSVKRYYKNWVTIDDPSQLQGAQIEKLKEALQLEKHRKKKAAVGL